MNKSLPVPLPQAQRVAKSLADTTNYDPDIKETGALDLAKIIVDEKVEEATEKRICTAFIEHLRNENTQVRATAVRCINNVASRISDSNLTMILTKLSEETINPTKEANKDSNAIHATDKEMSEMYALAIENILETTHESAKEEVQENIIKSLGANMLKGIETKPEHVKIACLSICTRLFKVFGQLILRSAAALINKDQFMKAIIEQMTKGTSMNLKKKAS